MSSKKLSQIFKILFQTGDINILPFLVDMFNEKAPFLTKKTLAAKSETPLCSEAIEN